MRITPFLLAVNLYPDAQAAAFEIAGAAPRARLRARLLFEKGRRDVRNGRLADSFEPYQRRCYRVPNAFSGR